MTRCHHAGPLWVLAPVVLLALGCGGPAGPPDDPHAISVDGQYVTLYFQPGNKPCAGTLAYLDANVAALARYLDLPIGSPIPYHYTQDLSACASQQDLGCAVPYDGGVSCWSRSPTTTHELVHAVQLQHPGSDAPSFLLEGEAVALGQNDRPDLSDSNVSDDVLLSADPLAAADYGLAGDFVSYLLTRFGPAPFERMLAAIGPHASVDEIETTFAAKYVGKTMANLRADRAASPVTFYWNRLDLNECMTTAPDARLGRAGTITETVDCSSNAYGSLTVGATRHIAFDISAEGLYRLTANPQSGSVIKLETCGGGRVLELSHFLEAPAVVVGHLHAGRYAFVLTALDPSTPPTFTLGVEPLALTVPLSCDGIEPVRIATGTKNVYLFSMDDRTLDVPFVLEAPASPSVAAINPLSTTALCRGGCGVDCQAASPLVRLPQLMAGATVSVQATLLGQPDLVGLLLE